MDLLAPSLSAHIQAHDLATREAPDGTNSIALRHPADSNARKRRLRFTLRTLFAIVSGSAIVIWWIQVPTQKVNWFAVEVNIGKSESALAMVSQFEKSESWRRSLVRQLVNRCF
jgi:hypothetical protein